MPYSLTTCILLSTFRKSKQLRHLTEGHDNQPSQTPTYSNRTFQSLPPRVPDRVVSTRTHPCHFMLVVYLTTRTSTRAIEQTTYARHLYRPPAAVERQLPVSVATTPGRERQVPLSSEIGTTHCLSRLVLTLVCYGTYHATINTALETIMDAIRRNPLRHKPKRQHGVYLTRPRGRTLHATAPTRKGSLPSVASCARSSLPAKSVSPNASSTLAS
jgi:hypothetical protein